MKGWVPVQRTVHLLTAAGRYVLVAERRRRRISVDRLLQYPIDTG